MVMMQTLVLILCRGDLRKLESPPQHVPHLAASYQRGMCVGGLTAGNGYNQNTNFTPFVWFVFADPGRHHRLQSSGACDWFLWVARFASAVHRSTHHHSDRFADRPVGVHHSRRQSRVSLGPVSTVRHLSAYLPF